jgi:hypothetical protein
MLPPGGSETALVISKIGNWQDRPSTTPGERILHNMQLGDDAPAIAKRLTMEIYRMLRGETATGV